MVRRVVLFPCPFQGHANSMFQLAGLLHSRGFSITMLHTELNFPDPTKWPFHFVPVSDGLSAGEAFPNNMIALAEVLNANCEAPFSDRMAQMLAESSPSGGSGKEPIACLIVDALFYRIQAAAKRNLRLPTLVLRTGSAANFGVSIAYPMLMEKGYLPVKDSEMDVLVTELPPFRVKDLIRIQQINIQQVSGFIERMISEARTSSGIIFNTFEAIEAAELEIIGRELHVPAFAIGPLHKLAPTANFSMMVPDYHCMQWLDNQASGSVLYVSFGSAVSIDERELLEVAWGLADSHQPFLWVVRPGSVGAAKLQQVELPKEFEEEIRGRGMIVRWAPQQEVLGHPAVGGFWTHSGWNSTLESLCEGIPMLCMPCFSDQFGNARYASHVWKVGITLENGPLQRGDITKAIKKLMTENEGDEMRVGAQDLKKKAANCIKKDGSSCMAFDKLLDQILSFEPMQN